MTDIPEGIPEDMEERAQQLLDAIDAGDNAGGARLAKELFWESVSHFGVELPDGSVNNRRFGDAMVGIIDNIDSQVEEGGSWMDAYLKVQMIPDLWTKIIPGAAGEHHRNECLQVMDLVINCEATCLDLGEDGLIADFRRKYPRGLEQLLEEMQEDLL